MRIGLFGGTFNPIHFGHLRAAEEVFDGFDMHHLYFIPSALPPHKDWEKVASAADRLEMTKLALTDHPGFLLSDAELQRCGPSFTIDTVNEFKDRLGADTEIYLVMGMDAFLEIDTWKSYRQLLALLPIVVMTRPCSAEKKHMSEFIRSKISASYRFSEAEGAYLQDQLPQIFLFDISMLDISGTKIRHLVKQGCSIRFLVPPQVEAYIFERGIYT